MSCGFEMIFKLDFLVEFQLDSHYFDRLNLLRK